MFRQNLIPVWAGIIVLSGMFLMGQDAWPPQPPNPCLEEGDVELECGAGLTCCYPCGVEGCDFICTPTCDESDPACQDGCILYP